MKSLLKNAREQKGLKTREVAQILNIDQALISKFENGSRRPTRDQIIKLATLLEINIETILILWIKEKILSDVAGEEFGIKALEAAQKELIPKAITKENTNPIDQLFEEMNVLKNKLEGLRDAQQSGN